MASWVDSAIWWQVYPLGFAGADKQARPDQPLQHGLPGPQWLDYLVELGCNGLALGPIFSSETHGYDSLDLFRLDSRLGDDADFDALVSGCRERGVRLLLDGVFNHVGRGHPRFVEALEQGPGSAAARWFHLSESSGQVVAQNFEGHDQLVVLNHAEPAVIQHVTDVMNSWLDRGVDGWRLDAAYAVPAEFWATVLPAVRKEHPEAWFVGEVIHGDYVDYITRSTLDSVTEYELWKAIWSSLKDHNLHELTHTLGRHNALLEHFAPLTFVGNHDVTRLASLIGEPRLVAHALAVLLFVGGVPTIYYGDEQGFEGIKEERFGGDDAIRPAFPASREDLPESGWSVFHLHQQMISIRRRHPWLARVPTETLHVTNESLALAATSPDGERLVLLLNLGDAPLTVPVDLGGVSVVEQSAGSAAEALELAAAGWAVVASG
jgi:cyclomaltodextrinase